MNNSKQEILSQSIKDNRIVPMTIQGDSMQPEYYDSDIVLVDTEYKMHITEYPDTHVVSVRTV